MEKLNIPTDRAQRADEKNGIIGLVIRFFPRVTVINISKGANYLQFLVMSAKNQSQFGQNIQMHLKDLVQLFFKKPLDYWLLSHYYQNFNPRKYKILVFFYLTQQFFKYFFLIYLTIGSSKAYSHHFLKELNEILQVHLIILPKL